MKPNAIEKTLSANDVGATGGHQAGILVPKSGEILSFFPFLDSNQKNPRTSFEAIDELGHVWTFSFIHYNNRRFGGTRNEYRLTGMTAFFREFNLKAGDTIALSREDSQAVRISVKRSNAKGAVLRLSSNWKVIDADF